MGGAFISFEGIEGSGKTTAMKSVSGYFKKKGYDLVLTREPGGTAIGDKIRAILLSPESGGISPAAELMLYCASRAQHVKEVIAPAVKDGKIVLCDRFSDATLAYQGYARGLDIGNIRLINEIACEGMSPDLTIYFDIDVEKGLLRARSRNDLEAGWKEGRFEKEDEEFHRKVREGYRMIANEEKGRFRIIDASVSRDKMTEAVINEIEKFLCRV